MSPLRNLCVMVALCVMVTVAIALPARAAESTDQCVKTARHLERACVLQAQADFWSTVANCDNLASEEERNACRQEAREAYNEATEACGSQHAARVALCDLLGGPYDPTIRPEDFVAKVDHPYYPLVPGTLRIYEKRTQKETERIEIRVTDDIEMILGVPCTVVRATEFVNGVLVEDTLDWFAQDVRGNVWYFGESSNHFEDSDLVSLEGSWKAGVDGAKPGIVMMATPRSDDTYRQEFALGASEDAAQVLGFGHTIVVPFGKFQDCILTEDFSPLELERENKFFAPGIGLVLEVNPQNGERLELVDMVIE